MYKCAVCGHVYMPDEGEPSLGIPPGTPFSELPDDFLCPICGAPKEEYHPFE
ncbi:MAG: rubredoxin [Bacteroidales bacterium]